MCIVLCVRNEKEERKEDEGGMPGEINNGTAALAAILAPVATLNSHSPLLIG